MPRASPGDVVVYQPFGGGTRTVRVEIASDDIKNGRPGFDGKIVTGENDDDGIGGVWGYDSQILEVRRRDSAGD